MTNCLNFYAFPGLPDSRAYTCGELLMESETGSPDPVGKRNRQGGRFTLDFVTPRGVFGTGHISFLYAQQGSITPFKPSDC